MNREAFETCFNELCLSFDLDPERKATRIDAYFNSKLGALAEYAFIDLIKKARESLEVKPGYLPAIKELINLYYTIATNSNKPKSFKDRENFHDAICATCSGTGWVSKEIDGYNFCIGCCTCITGQNKQLNTKLGQELGTYKKEKVPF